MKENGLSSSGVIFLLYLTYQKKKKSVIACICVPIYHCVTENALFPKATIIFLWNENSVVFLQDIGLAKSRERGREKG